MKNEDVIRMAREAGIKEQRFCVMCSTGSQLEELERFAALVIAHAKSEQINLAYQQGYEEGSAHEREACAKVCEEHGHCYECGGGLVIAEAIRARGEK